MHVRCPHCHNPIELVADAPLREIDCPSCGSRFNLVIGETTVSYHGNEPRTLGQFRLIDQIGTGRFGSVWKAKDTELDRMVAIKIPRSNQLDPEETEMFFREARAAAQLKHASIVSVHEVGREDDTIYIVSDLVDGANLKEWLSGQRLSAREAAELCAKLADALHYAHEQGIVHRDLKPSNIMMDLDGEPHIMDFGLAKREFGEITMTMEGQILGTPAYMPPEQARGEGHHVDRRADIYALGVILFELLTGELPFRGDTRMLIVQILRDEPPSPRKLNAGVNRDLATICLKCLRKEADRRYGTAAELAADLRRCLEGEPIKARPVSRIERTWLWCRRRPAIAGSIAAILLVACITTGIILTERQRRLRVQTEAAVSIMSTTRGNAVPFAIEDLDDFPRDMVLEVLRERFEAGDDSSKLPLAYALAAHDDVRLGFLVGQIEDAAPDEIDNLMAALALTGSAAVELLNSAANSADAAQDWRKKARMAMIALHLGDPKLAHEMCLLQSDPIQRTWFIAECAEWHGDLSKVCDLLAEIDDVPLRTALVLAAGGARQAEVTSEVKQAWERRLLDWYGNEPDTLTHSAVGWTIRRWGLELPEVAPSAQPVEDRDWHVNSVGLTMLLIPNGQYRRTDSVYREGFGQRFDGIDQEVNLTKSFLFSDSEVSRAQFQMCLNDPEYPPDQKPSSSSPEGALSSSRRQLEFYESLIERVESSPDDFPKEFIESLAERAAEYSQDFQLRFRHMPPGQHPVCVDWSDAVMFCNWLSQREGLTACYEPTENTDGLISTSDWRLVSDANGYRLPTEAEFEFACRAGTLTVFSWGDDQSFLDHHAVCHTGQTDVPRTKLPNAWGLFDVHGNVAEWCHDLFAAYESEAEVTDPTGPREVELMLGHVVRGGSYADSDQLAPSAARTTAIQIGQYRIGFRVARTYP